MVTGADTSLPTDLSEVKAHVEKAYPNEGCGVLLRAKDGSWRVQPMDNVYDKYHAKDPSRFPRTSRTAYLFDPREWLRVSEDADAKGDRVHCIFHSHGDVGAYFSAEDKAMAAPDGEPLFPEASYLVLGVDHGRTTHAKLFTWQAGNFVEHPVTL